MTLPGNAIAGDALMVTDGTTTSTFVLTAGQIAAGFVSTAFAPPLDGGTLTVTATVTDQAGNVSPSASDTATRDSTPPVADPVLAIGTEEQVVPIVVTLHATDSVPGSGVASFQLSGLPANGTLYTLSLIHI